MLIPYSKANIHNFPDLTLPTPLSAIAHPLLQSRPMSPSNSVTGRQLALPLAFERYTHTSPRANPHTVAPTHPHPERMTRDEYTAHLRRKHAARAVPDDRRARRDFERTVYGRPERAS